ncbi:hypothetical protein XENOCAPTIV_009474 [Xenoophorus captivus]|uniref:Replication factor-A protein 1 N-terminal domain-containing protein n=1 Tax=Xenoophorus captivus TaxID=1517983 RepID=A0ABV0RPN6_9TELE
MTLELTRGAVEALFKGSQINNPVLQLLNIRQISNNTGPPRYRLMMSDGQHLLSSFLLATQLNHLAEDNLLVPQCVCMLRRTTTNTLSDGRHVVVVVEMEILKSAEDAGGKIGNPTPYLTDGKLSSPHKVSSTTSEPASASAAEVPGPSSTNNNNKGERAIKDQSMKCLYVLTFSVSELLQDMELGTRL